MCREQEVWIWLLCSRAANASGGGSYSHRVFPYVQGAGTLRRYHRFVGPAPACVDAFPRCRLPSPAQPGPAPRPTLRSASRKRLLRRETPDAGKAERALTFANAMSLLHTVNRQLDRVEAPSLQRQPGPHTDHAGRSYSASLLTRGAGAIHFAAAPGHFSEYLPYGLSAGSSYWSQIAGSSQCGRRDVARAREQPCGSHRKSGFLKSGG